MNKKTNSNPLASARFSLAHDSRPALSSACGSRSRVRGQAALELALMAPVLTLLLVVAADFARVFYVSITLDNAARAGVQYGAQSTANASDLAGMQQAALDDTSDLRGIHVTASASNFCECNGARTSCSQSPPACRDMSMYVQVITSGQFQTLVPWPGVPSKLSLSQTAVMRAL